MNEPELYSCNACGLMATREGILVHECGARGLVSPPITSDPTENRWQEAHQQRQWTGIELNKTDAAHERIEFIRRAAIATLEAASWNPDDRANAMAECWDLAKALWDAKPEDC